MRSRQYLPMPMCDEYVMTFVERFGNEYEDLIAELMQLKQIESVKRY